MWKSIKVICSCSISGCQPLGSGSCAAWVPRSPWLYVALRLLFGDRKVSILRRRPELSRSHIYARRANKWWEENCSESGDPIAFLNLSTSPLRCRHSSGLCAMTRLYVSSRHTQDSKVSRKNGKNTRGKREYIYFTVEIREVFTNHQHA
jgi:hypothetical protein